MKNPSESERRDVPTLVARFGFEEWWQAHGDRAWEWFNVAFFVGGFLFDVVTVGGMLNGWKLAYIGLYAAGTAVCLVAKGRDWWPELAARIDYALHFCLGATFSALAVLYFRSAGHVWTFSTVLLLVALLIWNEWARGEADQTVVWGIYAVSLVMYVNVLLPFVAGTIASWLFYGSLFTALAALYSVRRVAGIPARAQQAAAAAAAGLALLYALGAIPPVPLVMKQNIACVNPDVGGGTYACRSARQDWPTWAGLRAPTVRYGPGDTVTVLSAVAAPTGLEATLEHRWQRFEEGEWSNYDRIELDMTGGRAAGWRFYSYKRNMLDGRWRVRTAVVGGAVLGDTEFDARSVPAGATPRRRRVTLD